MSLKISQETYNNAVKENMEEFGMTAEEAVEDTVKQFEAQGVDLSDIIKNLMVGGGLADASVLNNAVKKLGDIVKEKDNKAPKPHIDQLTIIKTECDKGLQYRVQAGKEGAYFVVLDTLLKFENNKDVVFLCFQTLTSLMTQQPDLLEDSGIRVMMSYIDKEKDTRVLQALLKWIRECCLLHEFNRQKIMNNKILDHLKTFLQNVDAELLRSVLAVLRALVLDDDIRVEFGRAHDHARIIASDTLCVICDLLGNFKTDEEVVYDIMLTLASLVVRTEFCKQVHEANGVTMIKDAMVQFRESEKITRQCLKVLKTLAGNDELKSYIVQSGLAPIISESIAANKSSSQTCINGLAAVAALTLRNPANSKAFYEADIPEVIVDVLKQYPDNFSIVKNASWAIRNMVSRSRDQNPTFLSLGVEPLLKEALKKHKKCEYDVKAALRDLDCEVEFKEEWTGSGGALTSQKK